MNFFFIILLWQHIMYLCTLFLVQGGKWTLLRYYSREYIGETVKLITFFHQVLRLKMHTAPHLKSSSFQVLLLINFWDNFIFVLTKIKKYI